MTDSLRPAVVFPNVEVLLVTYLDGVLPVPVRADVPNPRPDEFVRVRRVGGVARGEVVDEATVVVEAYAAGPSRAYALAAEARAALKAASGAVVGGTTVHRVADLAGPSNLPDPDTTQSRYTFTAVVGVRGTAR